MRTVVLSAVLAASLWAADPVLRIEGVSGRDGVARTPLSLSLEELQTLPRTSVTTKTSDGKPRVFEGVALADILKRAGVPQGEDVRGPLLTRYLVVSAHDGYRAVFSLPELDPAFSDARALLAVKVNGQPLTARDGPLQLVLPSEKRESRWVRMVDKIEMLTAPAPVR